MRVLRATILLGLATLAWKALKPKMPAVKAQVDKMRDRMAPPVHSGAETLRDASLAVAETADSVASAVNVPAAKQPADSAAGS
jgi:hypothetical protein